MALDYFAARLGRLYPFVSGAGSFANMKLFRYLDPQGGPDAVAHVVGGRALVPGGDHVGRAMRFVGDLDPKVSWVVDRAVLPGDVVLDIGANLGLVSLRMAARVGTEGHVHAFEPQPRLQTYLRQTMEMTPDAPITLHPVALGEKAETLSMAVPAHNAGAASLREGAAAASRSDVQMIDVPVHRLTDYAQEAGLTRVDFIKMDVEGFEANVIRGGLAFLAKTQPRAIILEENKIDPDTGLSPALEMLTKLDYTLYSLPRQLMSVKLHPMAARVPAHDYVALSPAAPASVRRALGV